MPPETFNIEVPPTTTEQKMRQRAEKVIDSSARSSEAYELALDVLTLLDSMSEWRNAMAASNERVAEMRRRVRDAIAP